MCQDLLGAASEARLEAGLHTEREDSREQENNSMDLGRNTETGSFHNIVLKKSQRRISHKAKLNMPV